MQIEPFFDDRTQTLTYAVFDGKDAVLIDPVLDYEPSGGKLWTESLEKVARFVESRGSRVHWTLETHPHADHLSGAQWVKERLGAKVATGRRVTEVQAIFQGVFNWPELATDGRQFDRLLDDGEQVEAGPLRLEVIATPGHTPACVCFRAHDAVFTGDALFLDDVGVARCDFPKGDAGTLYESVTKRLYTLPDATRVFPGHDYPPGGRAWKASTTIGAAKASNVHLSAGMTKEEFVARRTARDRTLGPPRLLYPSVQVNIDAGRLPQPESNGRRYLRTPLSGP